MTEAVPSSVAVKRRQYLLLAGVGVVIVVCTLVSVSLTGSKPSERQPSPKSTNILAPGAQVDPRDAWRGQADAQLRAIEQKSRELAQRGSEMEGQSREMVERLRKLEVNAAVGSTAVGSTHNGLTALPPPPIAAPAARPNFGPDAANGAQADSVSQRAAALQQLPPPPPPQPNRNGSFGTMPATGSTGLPPGSTSAIVSIALTDPTTKPGTDTAVKTSAPRDTRRYLPSGAFTRALLLGGLDAPTGGQAQRNPQPVLLRLMDNAVLPNQFRAKVKECFVVGAGYGDVSAERAYIRTESLSCITRDGTAIDVPIKGYVAGEDGKAGMRGRLVSKQGQILANALLAGVASGIGQAFTQSATTMSISPLGSTSSVDPGKQLQAGLGTGVGKALDRLAQYYITLAEKVFPVIEIDAGRTVDVVLTQGIALQGSLDNAAQDAETYPRLAARGNQRRSSEDDDE